MDEGYMVEVFGQPRLLHLAKDLRRLRSFAGDGVRVAQLTLYFHTTAQG